MWRPGAGTGRRGGADREWPGGGDLQTSAWKSKRRAGARVRNGVGGLHVIECVGADTRRSAHWLDELHAGHATGVLAREPWLRAWTESFPAWEPWVITILDAGGVPRATAPLARRRFRWGVGVIAMGDPEQTETPLVAVDRAAADALATAIGLRMRSGRRPWALRLRQLPPAEALMPALRRQFPVTATYPDLARPVLSVAGDTVRPGVLTRNTTSVLAKARNRAAREGRRIEIQHLDAWSQIAPLLGELEVAHRARDLDLRGRSLLNDPLQRRFYRQVLDQHRALWRLTVVRIDGALGAYALCLRDRDTVHVWDNRVAPAGLRFSAGLMANVDVVVNAATDPAVRRVDWGVGVQRYKQSLSDALITADALIAWSSPWLRGYIAARRRLSRSR